MNRIVSSVAVALCLAAPAAFAQSQGKQSSAHSGASHKMMQSMTDGMKEMQSMPMTGGTDRDFAAMMKKHHEMAIEMAQVELKEGKDAKLKAMAQKIVDDQRKALRSRRRTRPGQCGRGIRPVAGMDCRHTAAGIEVG